MGTALTNWGGKKSPKLHKYTLKLYNYAVLRVLDFYGEWGADGEKICQVETPKNWNRILMFVTLHHDGCYFAS